MYKSALRRIAPSTLLTKINDLYSHRLARVNSKSYPQVAIFSFDHIGISINTQGRFEGPLLDAILDFLRSEQKIDFGLALDIGANIGNHALFFARAFQRVVAFEPNPRTFQLLTFNAALNPAIDIRPYGLGARNERASLVEDPNNIGGAHVVSDQEDGFNIEIRRLDDVDDLLDRKVDLIKLDVEGFEHQVLLGGKDLIARCKPVILFEQAETDFHDGKNAAVETLRDLGYHFLVPEENFRLGESLPAKALSLCLRILFGERYVFHRQTDFKPRYYPLVIALPGR